ncbi:hypothetical protein [Rhodococcus maanshanensis]|uniref:Uncharacterized protein n=1 Tax=Rhodococcus maanshanensis TaxID=183556 RepID=A0A1H7U0Z2_9NOCA|nr:hypothetical protein [Rhodococcus maanshanensis]SEL90762.1 hypothetical protein SAMN05444583_11720 [Rhodococcus maanshanensis]
MVWSEIGVVFGFVVVCAAIAVVLIGVTMLFIVSIWENFGQRKPRGFPDEPGGRRSPALRLE